MPRYVLSASRRTDIPAFYMPWFMTGVEQGFFEVVNPYNQKCSIVPADVGSVHTVVFWSKNFGPFLDGAYDRLLAEKGYRFFFNFTINSPDPVLEPLVPPLDERLDQMAKLADRYGPDCIQWRFDPICFYVTDRGAMADNLASFAVIADRLAAVGITVCITSFVDLYRKVLQRQIAAGVRWIDPPLSQKVETICNMSHYLGALDVTLMLCCEKTLLSAIPKECAVKAAACIPNDKLIRLYGPGISLGRDTGQRVANGCGCGVSKDIGSYVLHPCAHNCLFCYANPTGKRTAKSSGKMDQWNV